MMALNLGPLEDRAKSAIIGVFSTQLASNTSQVKLALRLPFASA